MQATNFITLDRASGSGRYADVIDVCDHLRNKYGSPTNALAQLARQSDEFRQALQDARDGKQADPSAA